MNRSGCTRWQKEEKKKKEKQEEEEEDAAALSGRVRHTGNRYDTIDVRFLWPRLARKYKLNYIIYVIYLI